MFKERGLLKLVCSAADIGILRFHAWSKTMEMFMARFLFLSNSVL